MKQDNIILIGMPGSGKSSVANLLSKKTGLDCIDSDFCIEKNEGFKISDIFNKQGENYFRDLETAFIKSLLNKNCFILSTGGGIVLRDENIELLKKIGLVFFLNVSLDNLYERVKDNNERPLLNKKDQKFELEVLYNKRCNQYFKADYIIDGNNSIKKITDEIIKIYENNHT